MDLEIPTDEPGSAEPELRQGSHMLTVTYDASGTELAEITMAPNDVPIDDLVTHAVRTNNLRFFVRELRARVGNYYCRRDEIETLQVGQAEGSPRCPVSVREESNGMVSMQLPNVSPQKRHAVNHLYSWSFRPSSSASCHLHDFLSRSFPLMNRPVCCIRMAGFEVRACGWSRLPA